MQASAVFAVLLASAATATNIPITEKVSIEGTEVYSQSAGHAQLNTCTSFPRMFVDDVTKPSVTVCGVQTKVTVFLRNSCAGYSSYQQVIGTCGAGGGCVTESPATKSWLAHAQSYKIEQCATGTQR